MNNLILTDTVVLDSMSDKLFYGLQTTLLGLGIIFLVLGILWLSLVIFRFVFYDLKNKKTEAPAVKAPAPAPVAEAVATPMSVSEADEAELVAAITAAISIVMDQPQTSFRVVSFRRTASK